MKIYLKEKIGNTELFTGRNKELTHFLNWINKIKPEQSKSTALLSRRKTGKTALLQRLYNMTFEKNDGVIPFYYELREGKQWAVDFSRDFYLTFIYQYIAFKTRKPEYITLSLRQKSFARAKVVAAELGEYLVDEIREMEEFVKERSSGAIWDAVRETPWTLILQHDERVVQMVDEFQYLNKYIYWDEALTNQADDFAAGYMRTAEYKNAPLLVAGSWVGWLMDELTMMLPGRFIFYTMEDMPQNEAIEMVYRYATIENVPVTEEIAYLIAGLCEGSPFYISCLFGSISEGKDFTTQAGVLKTLEYETLIKGQIRRTWLEYIEAALPRINEQYAKDIVLYLSKYRDKSFSRAQLKKDLNVDLSDIKLKKKLDALLRSDIIESEYAGIYQGVQDNIFDKVFRSEYGQDIEDLGMVAHNEYKALFEQLQAKYETLQGKHNRYKGAFAEFMIIQHLRFKAHQDNERYKAMMHNLPVDFEFVAYPRVWPYHSPPLHELEFQVDLFAPAFDVYNHVYNHVPNDSRAKVVTTNVGYSLIGEVKHRKRANFSLSEAEAFVEKAAELCRLESVEKHVLFVFSTAGFTQKALYYFKANNIAWSDDEKWLKRDI